MKRRSKVKTKVAKHYGNLDKTKKDIEYPKGFFSYPQNIKGKHDHGIRQFLIFYFDSKEDYELVLKHFRDNKSKARSHPALLTHKLVECAEEMEDGM